jgi:hypothetical protein
VSEKELFGVGCASRVSLEPIWSVGARRVSPLPAGRDPGWSPVPDPGASTRGRGHRREPKGHERRLLPALRAGTEEIYRILEARLTGLPAAGIWFPVYSCQRIEVREPVGEILPACMGLEFELADFELQPLPPRFAISVSGNRPIDDATEVVDLVGAPSRLPTIEFAPNSARAPSIAQQTRRLLTGKGGDT